jgi:glutathione peroxidase-family protein/soluble cytochrome b562
MTKKIIYFLLILFLATGCNKGGKFTVEGNIANGNGKILYFEKTGLVKDSLIDSVKLKSAGSFKFSSKKPVYPDLYRIRMDNQQLILAIDSTETIEIQASANNLIDAKITGSKESEDIQNLRKSVVDLQKDYTQILNDKNSDRQKILFDSFQTKLDKHKKMAIGIILSNPGSLSSYYSLYQQIEGKYIFSPYEKDDLKYFQAVATSFYTFKPNFDRTKNLYNLVIDAISENRKSRNEAASQKLTLPAKSMGFIEMELQDKNGYPQKLSSMVGNPILIDFIVFADKSSVDHTFALRDIYNKYKSKGLQIYQVSVDENKLFWEQAVSNIPWTSVYDENGAKASIYNVQQIPTMFLINKEGNIIGRYKSLNDVEKVIPSIL